MAWEELKDGLKKVNYISSDELALCLDIAIKLDRPILLEGEAGVGKTTFAKSISEFLNLELIRLQCYEGLDVASSIYEWNYQKQLLSIKSFEKQKSNIKNISEHIFSKPFLLERPILKAISGKDKKVLLIDEVDRADEEFEAYLLEVLSEFQISIPEYGTIKAIQKPIVIITSNNTRDLSDALRRRCLYNYVKYPSKEIEIEILNKKMPYVENNLSFQIVNFIDNLRKEELEKKPGIAETLDWTAAISGLGIKDLSDNPEILLSTMVCLLKTESDQSSVTLENVRKLSKI